MRWPWQPRTLAEAIERGRGRARGAEAFPLSDKWAVEFYKEAHLSAKRITEVEAEIAANIARSARYTAEAIVLEAGVSQEIDHSAIELPLTSDGHLHEEAFRALVDAQVWRIREQQLATLTDSRQENPR